MIDVNQLPSTGTLTFCLEYEAGKFSTRVILTGDKRTDSRNIEHCIQDLERHRLWPQSENTFHNTP